MAPDELHVPPPKLHPVGQAGGTEPLPPHAVTPSASLIVPSLFRTKSARFRKSVALISGMATGLALLCFNPPGCRLSATVPVAVMSPVTVGLPLPLTSPLA